MITLAHQPSAPLNQYIRLFFYYKGLQTTHRLDRFLPDGNTELVIDLLEEPQHIYDNEKLISIQACSKAWLSGIRTKPLTIPSGNGARMFIVYFQPGAIYRLLGIPYATLTDQVIPAADILGSTLLELRNQLQATSEPRQLFQLAENFFTGLKRKAEDPVQAACVNYAVQVLHQYPTGVSMEMLHRHIGYSSRHFIDLFNRQVGVSPKVFSRIVRFQQAIQEIESGKFSSWAKLALSSGFHDQAHFIHEFRHFSGFTPAQYTTLKNDTLNYVPVA